MALSVADARVLVGLDANDNSRDARLQQLINAAYEQAADAVGPLTASTVTETACNQRGELVLRQPPVTAVATINGAVVSGLRIGRRFGLVTGLPATVPSGDVVVVYTSGYSAVPASIEEGVRLLVRHRWSLESYGTDTYGDSDVGAVTDFDDLPNAVRTIWAPFLLDRGGFA
ncbi:hypothetical protein [Klenkia brasiliensis]|uniref:Phage gp6-like head-tail connector protein n=1 Tax=Klenkia brasiliensis TaxID=333142 RepID=A0A1G7YGE8_9ACTN|nr:hypothetical protein [Klenkia brasiliensis]SDG95319.1 hypothetical protein SAMN05660324_3941 [Klenkia brasiliensis]